MEHIGVIIGMIVISVIAGFMVIAYEISKFKEPKKLTLTEEARFEISQDGRG